MSKLNWAEKLARQAIVNMSPYAARGGATDALHLDANESPYAPPPVKSTTGYNLYPQQQPERLLSRLSALYGTPPETIMVGRGADEGIEVLVRTFCETGVDKALICSPTFGYYQTCTQIQGVDLIDVPLDENFQWNMTGIQAALMDRAIKIVFLCSPNNPSGNELDQDFVVSLCTQNPNVLIVVDEAYVEFSKSESLADLDDRPRNLIVLRTLSKVYALAGARVGVVIADQDIIDLMLKVLPPYPIARPVEETVLDALSPAAMSVHAARRTETLQERAHVETALQSSSYIEHIYPSSANFLLAKIKDIETLNRQLAMRNIRVRRYNAAALAGMVRISIGSPTENAILLSAFGVKTEEKRPDRLAEAHRKTKETDIAVRVNLDETSDTIISTGLGFFDHMLEALSKHGDFGLILTCEGDLHIDAHHTIEDCALTLGGALKQALGDRAGIGRFGFTVAMDETQARVAIDLSGRSAFTFKGEFPSDGVGAFASEMCPHFFASLAQTLGAAIQIEVEGENTHHMIEACFKGVGRAIAPAFARSGDRIPSTKGVL